ncbi:hypothetical protein [Sphingomonas sp. Ant20]|uniref:hypothetical protein n=1 Tax=Sphingomonas sp. Ant20 TaxID=104605 RepID=UPI002740F2C9|nr:hypothetical protein [Sphingomonas sp. Ant20]
MCESRGQRRGLAGARAGDDQDGAVGGQHRLALGIVEAAEIGRLAVCVGRMGDLVHR